MYSTYYSLAPRPVNKKRRLGRGYSLLKTASQKKRIMGALELSSFKFRGGFEEKRIEAGGA